MASTWALGPGLSGSQVGSTQLPAPSRENTHCVPAGSPPQVAPQLLAKKKPPSIHVRGGPCREETWRGRFPWPRGGKAPTQGGLGVSGINEGLEDKEKREGDRWCMAQMGRRCPPPGPRPELHRCLPGWMLQWPRPGTSLSGGAQPTEPGVTGGRSPHHTTAPQRGKQCIGSPAPKAGASLHLHQAKQSACGFPGRSVIKNPPTKQETWVPSLGREDPLEEEMATHSRILAWKILWTDG